LKHFVDIDLSQFRLEPEPAAGGMHTDRQILVRIVLILIDFLAIAALIVLIAYLVKHDNGEVCSSEHQKMMDLEPDMSTFVFFRKKS
jgi:hypothetical protein